MPEGKEEAKIPLKGCMCGKLEDGDPEEGRSELPCQSGGLLTRPAEARRPAAVSWAP